MKYFLLGLLTLSGSSLFAQQINCEEMPYDIPSNFNEEYTECYINRVYEDAGMTYHLKMMYDGPDGDFISIIETDGGPSSNEIYVQGYGYESITAYHFQESGSGCTKVERKWTIEESDDNNTKLRIEGLDGIFISSSCK